MKSRLKVPSPAMIVACVALLVALGGTSYAAIVLPNNSVGTAQLKSGAVTAAKVKAHTLGTNALSTGAVHSLTGQRGATGATGSTGATGAAGSALAYGDVPAAVSGGVGPHKGWSGAVLHQSLGVYCLTGFSSALSNVVASVDASSPDLGATAQAQIGSSLCPAGTQVEVQTYQGTSRANEPFNFVAN